MMMQQHIDISSVLRQTLACDLYSNLVTRKTGAAVRGQIERLLDVGPTTGHALTVIDFSQVSMIDFSCADEVVAKLLLRYADEEANEVYFLFRGVTDDHWDAIEAVLDRHGLALALESGDDVRVVGVHHDHGATVLVARTRRDEVGDAQRPVERIAIHGVACRRRRRSVHSRA